MSLLAAPTPTDTLEVRSLADGRPVVMRPLGSADAELLQDFVRRLSLTSRRMRFQSALRELQPGLLAQLTQIDHLQHAAFAAVIYVEGKPVMIGEARYAPSFEGGDSSEFAVAVADAWQHTGLGTALMEKLLDHARRSGVVRLYGDVLRGNTGMLRLAEKLGFELQRHPEGAWLARVVLDLPRRDRRSAARPPAYASA